MPASPGHGHPDRWLHDHLRGIEKALFALLHVALNQPGINQENETRLRQAAAAIQQVPPA